MRKILVVEDDKFLANAYRVKLTKSEYEVRVASDGDEALKILNEYVPDLIVLDLMMPKVDGFTVLKEIKMSDKFKHIPVIVASNLGQTEDVVRATKLGASDYIVKTDLTMKKFIEKINTFLTPKTIPPQATQ